MGLVPRAGAHWVDLLGHEEPASTYTRNKISNTNKLCFYCSCMLLCFVFCFVLWFVGCWFGHWHMLDRARALERGRARARARVQGAGTGRGRGRGYAVTQ